MRLAIVAAVLALTRVAGADPAAAEQAFQHGRELLVAGKLDEACAAFDQSLALDFQFGTLYNLAGCEEQRDHLATAWKHYQRLAAEDTNAARRTHAGELAAELARRAPKIVVTARAVRPPDLVVTIDGEATELGAAHAVNAGTHEVAANATGYRPWHTTIVVKDGATAGVALVLEATSGEPEPTRTDVDRRFERDYPVLGGGLVIGGGVALVAGIALAVHAKQVFDESRTAAFAGDASALARNRDAVTEGNIATALSITGLLAVPAGVFLLQRGTWIVTPHGAAIALRF